MTETRGISLPRPKHWSDNALCRGQNTEDYFPRGTTGVFLLHAEEAKKTCRSCPVVMACAQHAVTDRIEYGVWGGLDEVQRRRILRRISLDADRTGNALSRLIAGEWAKNPLAEAYLKRTEQEDDGHVRWAVASTTVTVTGRVFTPLQLGFELGHGRPADGVVRTTCGVANCVAAEHLIDGRMRRHRDYARTA